MSRFRARVTYANVTASLALVLALTGGAYAATQLPKNSVGSKQIKKNAVNSSKVKNGSLLSRDFKAGQLPAGPTGLPGATGATGPRGDGGPQGRPGADATKLFGHVQQTSSSGPATVVYGSGVTGATRTGAGEYIVTFNQSLAHCVAIAEPSLGNPSNGGSGIASLTFSSLATTEVSSSSVVVHLRTDSGTASDENFSIAVFC